MTKSKPAIILKARQRLHTNLCKTLFKMSNSGIPSIADKDSKSSVLFASGIFEKLNATSGKRSKAQVSGSEFERLIATFLEETFLKASSLRPGSWHIRRTNTRIDQFQQYTHLSEIQEAIQEDNTLAASIGQDYLIRPDIIILRDPESDESLNQENHLVNDRIANLTGLREKNNSACILHASISCKWTLRSDRAQNARSEGLNLTRNRKGRVPHIAIVTAEPLPSRIASLALGTGDIDFVYHVTLPELIDSVNECDHDDSKEMLNTMISGNRLRDISDLPLDLVI